MYTCDSGGPFDTRTHARDDLVRAAFSTSPPVLLLLLLFARFSREERRWKVCCVYRRVWADLSGTYNDFEMKQRELRVYGAGERGFQFFRRAHGRKRFSRALYRGVFKLHVRRYDTASGGWLGVV